MPMLGYVQIFHCLMYCASTDGGFNFHDLYRVVDAVRVHLPETARFGRTQIFPRNDEVDNASCTWTVAGLLVRVATRS